MTNALYTITYAYNSSIWKYSYLYLALSCLQKPTDVSGDLGSRSKLISIVTCMTLDISLHLCGLKFLYGRIKRSGWILQSLRSLTTPKFYEMFKLSKILVVCPNTTTAFEVWCVALCLFVSCHLFPTIWFYLATLPFITLLLWNNSGSAQREFSKQNFSIVGSQYKRELISRRSWQFPTGW